MNKILLVEDNRIAQLAAKITLQQAGFCIDIASNDIEAFNRLGKTLYELILMDINLDNAAHTVSGFEIATRIRSSNNLNQSTPIIALTAFSDDNYRLQAIKSGMNGYLVKPISIEELNAALSSISLHQ